MTLNLGRLRNTGYAWLEVRIRGGVYLYLANDTGSGWKILEECAKEALGRGGRLTAIQYRVMEKEIGVVYEDEMWKVELWERGELRE